MTQEEAEELIKKYAEGTCTDDEKRLYEVLMDRLAMEMPEYESGQDLHKIEAEIYRRLPKKGDSQRDSFSGARFWRLGLVAAFLLFFMIGLYGWKAGFLFSSKTGTAIVPAGNKAILKLPGGSIIPLNTKDSILVIGDQAVQYANGSTVVAEIPHDLNIETPKGGIYQIILPDGTKVWLNASSSLKYSSKFTGQSRQVELNGEAYFSVAKNRNREAPFVVKVHGQLLTVLGTDFNVNAYGYSSPVRTTLVDGAIKVNSVLLKPGQQSFMKDGRMVVREADMDSELAWKQGQFVFNDETLENIMASLCRWYNVDVEYRGADRAQRFGGSISRMGAIRDVLEVLELTKGVHFKIEGRKIIAMP